MSGWEVPGTVHDYTHRICKVNRSFRQSVIRTGHWAVAARGGMIAGNFSVATRKDTSCGMPSHLAYHHLPSTPYIDRLLASNIYIALYALHTQQQ